MAGINLITLDKVTYTFNTEKKLTFISNGCYKSISFKRL